MSMDFCRKGASCLGISFFAKSGAVLSIVAVFPCHFDQPAVPVFFHLHNAARHKHELLVEDEVVAGMHMEPDRGREAVLASGSGDHSDVLPEPGEWI